MSALPAEALEALRQAAARRDIARLVYVEPRPDPPFSSRSLVVVLDELPTEPDASPLHELVGLLGRALPPELAVGFVLPSPAGLDAATRGGVVVYERGTS